MIKCKKCKDTGIVEYYHDAGDHFGAGTAPGSGWKTKPCDCQKENNRSLELEEIVKQHEEIVKDKVKSNPSLMGWVCPVCGRGVAPFTPSCPCQQKYEITC